ncbi:MAG: hypothetical protein OXI57_04825 [Rhodospirillales bacterium]|nr:hypothetical protein [Rhodospirillales bacterium]
MEQHAYSSVKAREQWAAGQGAPIEINLFGHKRLYRFVPDNPRAPFPARKHLLRNGRIELGRLPSKKDLDQDKGLSFRIPQRDDYESISMIKSAYLMVFSLLGVNGYTFAENIGLQPIREQIMNPGRKILKGGFVGKMQFESEDYRNLHRSVVLLCRAATPPFWIVPVWNDYAVFLSCGSTEPIDKLVMNASKCSVPNNALAGWMSCRFSSSAAISGTVTEVDDAASSSLAGTIGGPLPTNKGGWLYVVVLHQSKEYIALPFCHKDDQLPSDGISIVDMLSEQEVLGRNLDQEKMASADIGPWAKEVPITAVPMDGGEKAEDKSNT